MVLFILHKLILQTRMRSYPPGLDVWFLVGPFVYFHTSCVRTVKALVRWREFAGSPKPSLVTYVICTIISWAGSFHSRQRLCLLVPWGWRWRWRTLSVYKPMLSFRRGSSKNMLSKRNRSHLKSTWLSCWYVCEVGCTPCKIGNYFQYRLYYSPALKKWGLYWICLVLPEFCGSVILS